MIKKLNHFLWFSLLLPIPAFASQEISFNELALTCAPHVAPATLQAITRTESAFNPYAIGVVNGSVKQPTTFSEAMQAVKKLHDEGKNFSMGLAQINKYNLTKYGLDYETVFDPCLNLKVGADILTECYSRTLGTDEQEALQKALSCYYSGNFITGFTQDMVGQPSYVERIVNNALRNTETQAVKVKASDQKLSYPPPAVPAIDTAKAVATITAKKNTRSRAVNAKKVVATELSPNKFAWDAFGDW